MPLPKPQDNEQTKDFISRCVKFQMDEKPDTPGNQAVAMCYSAARSAGRDVPEPEKEDVEKIFLDAIKPKDQQPDKFRSLGNPETATPGRYPELEIQSEDLPDSLKPRDQRNDDPLKQP